MQGNKKPCQRQGHYGELNDIDDYIVSSSTESVNKFLDSLMCYRLIKDEKNPRKKAARWDMQALTRQNNPRDLWYAILSDYIVIDLDEKNDKHGIKEFESITPEPFNTFTVKTPHDGLHYWFKRTSDAQYKSGDLKDHPGVEIKADQESDRQPAQARHPLSPGYKIVNAVLPAPIPAWLNKYLKPLSDRKPTEGTYEGTGAIPDGSRSNTLVKLAGYLRGVIGLDAEAIKRVLRATPIENPHTFPEKAFDDIAENIGSKPTDAKPEPARESFFSCESDLPITPADWQIKDYFEQGDIVELFGDSESMKSFIMIDMAYCIATGTPWHGHATRKGPSFIVAGEGIRGLKKRGLAWKINRGMKDERVPVYISKSSVSMLDEKSFSGLLADVGHMANEYGKPSVIFIDTLGRNMGGDENDTSEMNAFIRCCDVIRETFGCTIVIIHHCGHADKTRSRGAISLHNALDAEFKIDKDESGVVRMECTKMKDFEYPEPKAFQAFDYNLGYFEEDGSEMKKCVLKEIEYTDRPKQGVRNQGAKQCSMMQILKTMDTDGTGVLCSDWFKACEKAGVSRRTFYSNKKKWIESGEIELNGMYVQCSA